MSEENTQQSAEEIWQQEAAKLEAGDTPAPEVVPEVAAPSEEEVPQAEPEPEPQPEVSDPLDGLPDAVKAKLAEIDELKKANAQLLHHVKSTEGRVAAMQREAQIARQAAKAADDAPTSGQIAAASKNPEKWEALKQDFPEWSEAMEEYVSAKLATQPRTESAVSAQQIAGYVQQQVAQTRAEMQKAFEESRVEDRHGDWKQTVQTQEFVSWFQMQSPKCVRWLSPTQPKTPSACSTCTNRPRPNPLRKSSKSAVHDSRQPRQPPEARPHPQPNRWTTCRPRNSGTTKPSNVPVPRPIVAFNF